MLATLLIVFREVIEAGLIVGIVLAATKGVTGRSLWVSYGVLGGLAGAAVVAAFAGQLGALFEGAGQELFNAAILLIAVIMLAWHNVWMASHGRALAQEMKEVGAAVSSGQKPLAALAIVCGIAVLREGSEVVLFLYGIFASGGTSKLAMLVGGLLGLVAGAALSRYYLGLVIPTRFLSVLPHVWLAAGPRRDGARTHRLERRRARTARPEIMREASLRKRWPLLGIDLERMTPPSLA